MFTNDLIDTSTFRFPPSASLADADNSIGIPGEVRAPGSARISGEGIKFDGMVYHCTFSLSFGVFGILFLSLPSFHSLEPKS